MAEAVNYITGGTLPADSAVYQERAADRELFEYCLAGQFAYVLTSRQMGKSSLMARTARKLQAKGIVTPIVDLTSIGAQGVTAEQWFFGFLSHIESFYAPDTDLMDWWERHRYKPYVQRFVDYLTDVLLKETTAQIVVFVDEIDSTLGLGFTDDFFASIRSLHNSRAINPDLNRLSFVLLGVATPGELIGDQARTPFNIGQRVELGDFDRHQIESLLSLLDLGGKTSSAAGQILKWTGGQPYLTLKLCDLLAKHGERGDDIDYLAETHLLNAKARGEPHFQFIANYLIHSPADSKRAIFETYEQCFRGKPIPSKDADYAHNRLRLAGLLKLENGLLRVRNELYRRLFDLPWIRANRPTFWTERNKKIALRAFAISCLGIATVMLYLANEADTERDKAMMAEEKTWESMLQATSLRLVIESGSKLAKTQPGGDAQALRDVLAAYRLDPSKESWDGLLNGLTKLAHTGWIAEQAGSVTCFAFSPDGTRIVSVSGDGALQLWDVASGQPLGSFKGHEGGVTGVAFSPDGTRIVSGSFYGTLLLWDVASGQPIGDPLKGHEGLVTGVAFSPDGARIVSGSEDGTLRLWDAASGQPLGEPLGGHWAGVNDVAFSPDGKRIVSGSDDGTLRLWDVASGQPLGDPFKGHEGLVTGVAFSPDGTRIVSGSNDGALWLWDAASGEQLGEPLKGHEGLVTGVAFSPDGARIVSGSEDKTLRLWDAVIERGIGKPLKGHEDNVISVAFSPDGTRIVSGSGDGMLRLWNAVSGQPLGKPLKGHEGPVWDVAFSLDGTRIVSGSDDGTLRLWDAASGQPLGEPLKGHEGPVRSVVLSPDGTRIVSGSNDGALWLWDAASGQPIGAPLKGREGMVYGAAFSPDGTRIVSGSGDGMLWLWDAASGQPLGEPLKGHEGMVYGVAFSPDGTRIVSVSGDGTLRLWDAASRQPLGEPLGGHWAGVNDVAFSPDGTRIVSVSGDGTLRLWDAASGQPLGDPFKGHEGLVMGVAFSPDGARIVSGSDVGTLRLWDAASGQPLGEPLGGHWAAVNDVAFSPDGKRIVSGSDDGTLRLWPAAPSMWVDLLCKKLTLNMSHRYWRENVSGEIDYIEQCPGLPVPE